MHQFLPFQFSDLLLPVLGQDSVRFVEWDFPSYGWEWLLILGVIVLLAFWVIELYRRDTVELHLAWRILLPALRIGAIIGLIVVLLNPRTRTQSWADRPSRIAVLVDVSASMMNPAYDDDDQNNNGNTRFQQVVDVLSNSDWVADLKKQHEVSFYRFDGKLSPRLATVASEQIKPAANEQPDPNEEDVSVDWEELLQPTGTETRLGEVTADLLREVGGRTLAGIVVVSDGSENAGIDVQAANDLARQLEARIITLGTGGVEPPVNVELAKLVGPTDVQLGDPFDLEAFIRGQGLSGQPLTVQLLAREPGEGSEFYELDSRETSITEQGATSSVRFSVAPKLEGAWEYQVRVSTASNLTEIKTTDNLRSHFVNAFERPVRVLIFAGGPSWDYRFLCGTLNRHPGFEVDSYLQTGEVGISQDVDNVIFDFPADRADLFGYDLMICFDPDWSDVSDEGRALFEEWVAKQGGGVIFVAGDIHTPFLAGARDELSQVLDLYPVFLDSILPGIDLVSASTTARPLELTGEGKGNPILDLSDDQTESDRFWKEFPGFYRFYPTSGAKASALVYAKAGGVGDLTEAEAPIAIASQLYGQGRTFYLGSPEFYRVRAEDPDYFERFWTRVSREAAQNRLRRTNPRGSLLVDQGTVGLGEQIKVRARLLDADFEALNVESVAIEVEGPDGRLMNPVSTLRPDQTEAGAYQGEIRTEKAGRYEIRMRIPGTDQSIREVVSVEIPDLENRELQQNVRQLQILAAGTGGGYLPLDQYAKVPAMLPNSSERFLFGEQIEPLWDRMWFLFLVVGLFALEWLGRKILQLA